ncbi:Ras-related protein RABH1c [Toxocara canis]|uniref:Ras-related protein RABH1c n=1 Tax=Toxocara canis TaxID=6265 RepID=A0A0B2VEB5_TOXCA|nr:Ras-related protein RABH1c [Toxocara canis]
MDHDISNKTSGSSVFQALLGATMEHSWKSLYASERVKAAVREHADEVSLSIPMSKAKVVVLGNSGVGKTSIIYRQRYGGELAPYNATIGASFVTCEADVSGESVQMQIWDTAGQERFRCMVPMYMRNTAAAIIVYDITSRQSFNDVEEWIRELERCSGHTDPVLFLVGNKGDLGDRRQVAYGEGATKALMHNAKFYEITALDPILIDEMLLDLAKTIHSKDSAYVEEGNDAVLRLSLRQRRGFDVPIQQRCCGIPT